MKTRIRASEKDDYYVASVTDEYGITTVVRYIYPSDVVLLESYTDFEQQVFGMLRHTLREFMESCNTRGLAGLLGSYTEDVLKQATVRDDWENIDGIRKPAKTLEEVHRGYEL